jgi:hypothetical protein
MAKKLRRQRVKRQTQKPKLTLKAKSQSAAAANAVVAIDARAVARTKQRTLRLKPLKPAQMPVRRSQSRTRLRRKSRLNQWRQRSPLRRKKSLRKSRADLGKKPRRMMNRPRTKHPQRLRNRHRHPKLNPNLRQSLKLRQKARLRVLRMLIHTSRSNLIRRRRKGHAVAVGGLVVSNPQAG